MKALSGWQPWWHAILHLGKNIENRVPSSSAYKALRNYRHPFLLHASAKTPMGEFSDACDTIEEIVGRSDWYLFRHLFLTTRGPDSLWSPTSEMRFGGIIGRARCVGVIDPNGDPVDLDSRNAIDTYKPDMRWHMRGQFGLILADVEPLPFVPCKGALGLWECDYSRLASLPPREKEGG